MSDSNDISSSRGRALPPIPRMVALILAIPILLVGLFLVTFPVLDMLPFPGSGQNAFFEWWVPGIPLTWAGLRALRYGVQVRSRAIAYRE